MEEQQFEQWAKNFDDRQKKEIGFDILYAKDFAHGTDGHNSKMIIAKMAALLTDQEEKIAALVRWRQENGNAVRVLEDSTLGRVGKPSTTNDS